MLRNDGFFLDADSLTEEKIDIALNTALKKIKKYIPYFKEGFKPESSVNDVYEVLDHCSWVESFYTGTLWLAYELTGDNEYRETAEK